MTGVIYQDLGGEKLVPLYESPFSSEDVLQALLANYPNLLAGDQISTDQPRRWLLIKRETPVPDEEGASGRWSLDHLFLDQEGIPTLVEVKRSSDTRIRREVVGQMLDYAANAVAYWPIQDIQAMYNAQCKSDDVSPQERLSEFMEDDLDEDTLWIRVKTNLQAGRIRMVFVADEIPSELRRIVEFLNAQTDPAEILAVEIKQFVGENLKALVPRVIGQSEQAQQKKRPSRGQRDVPWDEESMFAYLRQHGQPEEIDLIKKITLWAKEKQLQTEGGRGTAGPTVMYFYAKGHVSARIFYFYKTRDLYTIFHIWFDEFRKIITDDNVVRLCEKLNDIPGVNLDPNRQYPGIKMNLLQKTESQQLLMESLDWLMELIKTKMTG